MFHVDARAKRPACRSHSAPPTLSTGVAIALITRKSKGSVPSLSDTVDMKRIHSSR